MRILFLCEGDAETHDSWSGVSRSVVSHLRELGHNVTTGDVELYGIQRLFVASLTIARPRRRWWVRYHLDEPGFRARSKTATRLAHAADAHTEVLFQIGATFHTQRPKGVRLALYCDSNIALSQSGAFSGYSEAAVLTPREFEEIRDREARVYHEADVIFTMSEMLRQSFIDDFGLDPERVITIHCAPNVDFPDLETEVDPHPPTVLFVGRDFARKGGDLLMDAFPLVLEQIPDARLRVVGFVPSEPQPEWAEFSGFMSRDTKEGARAIDRVYRQADAYCLPTRFEPFGTSFVEAMGYGLPCVGPDAWAVPEIIRHEETGYLVPPGDPQRIAEALVRLLADPELAQGMGRAGRTRALEHFTWPSIAGRVSDVLKSLP